jgi:cell pole-organizing protein PopZ
MEEILASIRRIIAEDGDTAAPPAAAKPAEKPAPASEPEPPPEEEVLELTEVVEPDGSVVSLAAAAAERAAEAAPSPPSPTPLVQTEEPLRRPEPVPPPPPAPAEQIVSPATAAASVASLAQLTALPGRGERSDIPLGAGHLTLEMLVREELRPILKDWLDRNLPDMVERIVKAEIARLVHDVQRR